MNNKIKLLYITKNFPPEIGGGLRRIEALYNIFMNNKNIDLKVITTKKDNNPNTYKNVQEIPQLFFKDKEKNAVTNFDQTKSSIKFFDKALAGWLPNVLFHIIFKKYDYVFASCPTFTNILIGFLYKLFHFGRPKLIIEYRDFFSLNPSFVEDFQKKILRFFEKMIFKVSDHVIVTTFGMKNILKKITGEKKLFLARNYISTFDIKKIGKLKKINFNNSFFNIGYVGKLNVGRNPVKVLRLLDEKAGKKKIALHFIGVNDKEITFIKNEANKMKLDLKRVFFQNLVTRERSLQLMKSFNALLILVNDQALIKDGYGIPGKLYDYIYTNNSIFSDRASFKNLSDEFNCVVKKEYKEFINFSINDKETLDNVFSRIFKRIIK